MIISPLNYPGNKARILKNILEILPKQNENFVDVFCGSAIVGLNTHSNIIHLNDKEKKIIELLEFFKNNELDFILNEIEKIIVDYDFTDSKSKAKNFYKIYKNEGLSKYNKQSFLKLRQDYNKHPSPQKLFALLIFGFNHYLRFNAQGLFNVPVGKMDFSTSLYNKTLAFIRLIQNKNIIFTHLDFKDDLLYEKGDFFYFDPPYLITNAPYNAKWDIKDEKALYEILDTLNLKNKKFALSNIIKSNGKENELLKKWAKKYKIININRKYTNANYRRKNLSESLEVLIINY